MPPMWTREREEARRRPLGEDRRRAESVLSGLEAALIQTFSAGQTGSGRGMFWLMTAATRSPK